MSHILHKRIYIYICIHMSHAFMFVCVNQISSEYRNATMYTKNDSEQEVIFLFEMCYAAPPKPICRNTTHTYFNYSFWDLTTKATTLNVAHPTTYCTENSCIKSSNKRLHQKDLSTTEKFQRLVGKNKNKFGLQRTLNDVGHLHISWRCIGVWINLYQKKLGG